jgi:CBS domain-containing protein
VNSEEPVGQAAQERARFLSRIEPFRQLGRHELRGLGASVVERLIAAGEAVLVENGGPGTFLYVVREGALEILHKGVMVGILTGGDVFGHPTLLTGEPPEFTTRARRESILYCIPKDVATEVLSRPEGVRFVVRTLRDRLLDAVSAARSLPDVRTRAVASLLRGRPVFCEADTSIADAARLMASEGLSALLVQTRDGLGIVTDVDIRDKVAAEGVSRDAPVSAVMSTPVKTVGVDLLAPEASLEMMRAGVNHLPVVDEDGRVVGVLSAGALMELDAISPFALRQSIYSAHALEELVDVAADIPKLLIDLVDAHLDAAALSRVLTVLSDAVTTRLLELAFDRYGTPPVAYAWLAFGSSGRSELSLASDLDNGLAFADTADPEVDQYFRLVSQSVIEGLAKCGFPADPHGVLAANPKWRRSQSQWIAVFSDSLRGWDSERLIRAAIAFDFRHVVGDLAIVPLLTDIIREAPKHVRFLSGLAELGTEIPSALQGFRQRLLGPIDIKKSALLPVQNLARYHAFAHGITAQTTRERLRAVQDSVASESEAAASLAEAYDNIRLVQLRHHADAVRAGRAPDNAIDTQLLRPLDKAGLQEALRVLSAAQRRLPQRAALM